MARQKVVVDPITRIEIETGLRPIPVQLARGYDSGEREGGSGSCTEVAVRRGPLRIVLRHPVVDAILDYRSYHKMQTSYANVRPTLAGEDGRVRTTLRITARISCICLTAIW